MVKCITALCHSLAVAQVRILPALMDVVLSKKVQVRDIMHLNWPYSQVAGPLNKNNCLLRQDTLQIEGKGEMSYLHKYSITTEDVICRRKKKSIIIKKCLLRRHTSYRRNIPKRRKITYILLFAYLILKNICLFTGDKT